MSIGNLVNTTPLNERMGIRGVGGPNTRVSNAKKLHAALLKAVPQGRMISMDEWGKICLRTMEVSRQSAVQFAETLHDLGLARWKKGEGVLVLNPLPQEQLQ